MSACLLGIPTRLDGAARSFPAVLSLADHYSLVPVCPEQLGGLATPRVAAEPCGGAGADVLDGIARVMTIAGEDVSDPFIKGAVAVLAIAELTEARGAVLKARSPSCGVGSTYDGTFTHTLQAGSGVTATLLQRAGLELFTEEDCYRLLPTAEVG